MVDYLRREVESRPDVRQRWSDVHREAVARERTAAAWQAWRDERVMQAAVAWVLATVFTNAPPGSP